MHAFTLICPFVSFAIFDKSLKKNLKMQNKMQSKHISKEIIFSFQPKNKGNQASTSRGSMGNLIKVCLKCTKNNIQ